MTKILMRSFIFFTLFSALISVAAAQGVSLPLAIPDEPQPRDTVSSQDYAITMSIPDTRSTVFPQEVVPNPLVSNGSNSWTTPEDDYSMQRPSDFDQLTETGTSPGFDTQMPDGQKGPNDLWIVDLTGLNHYPEMSIPLYGYAREEITPGMEGNITIEQMDPVGKVRTFGMGYVRPYHVYKMWFYGDVPGTHMIRYNINGYYSNIVRFYILEGQGQSMSNPVALSGSTGTRTGNNVVRSGGSYSSSSSSMSMSGGSMRISTSFG